MRKVTKKWLALMTSMAVVASASTQVGMGVQAYTTADRYVEEAKEHDYITGRPNEVTDYWGVVGEWCAMYVYYIAAKCGIGDQIGRYSYCDNQYGYNGFRNVYERNDKFAYRGDYVPQKGDLILFDWGYDGYCDHIGIVLGADTYKWEVYTIEGNVNDKVAYKTYSLSSSVVLGYCKTGLNSESAESGSDAQQPNDTQQPIEDNKENVDSGDIGDDIQYNNAVSRFKLTSPIGGWLRQSADYGLKLGVISTGTVLDAVLNKSVGDWIYVQDVPTENGLVSDGYVYKANIELIEEPNNSTNTNENTEQSITNKPVVDNNTGSENYNTSSEKVNAANYYVSSPIGANARTSAEFGDNIGTILSTNTEIYVDSWANGFAHCQIVSTGSWVYLHNTVIEKMQSDSNSDTDNEIKQEDTTGNNANVNTDSNSTGEPTHYVSSPIGCNMRADGSYSGKLIRILDTYQKIRVLSSSNSIGYVYCEADVPGVGTVTGYVTNTAIAKLY